MEAEAAAALEHVQTTDIAGDETFTATPGCRYYEERFPEVEQLVMVTVNSIAEMGAYVSLLEYGGLEGMILLSELSRRRFRSITKLIRVGKTEVVVVLRVDPLKGYIDLSKRRVSPDDIIKCEQRYNKAKQVHSIIRNVADATGKTMEELNQMITWPLYKKYGHAFDAFQVAVSDSASMFEVLNIPADVLDILMQNIRRRLTPQALRLRADIEVTCFAYEGIDAIRDALRAGEACGTAEEPIKIKLVAPPLFVMITQSLERERGLALLNHAIDAIRTKILSSGGELNVKTMPAATTERDDRTLASLMEKMELENIEVDGDDDNDEVPA